MKGKISSVAAELIAGVWIFCLCCLCVGVWFVKDSTAYCAGLLFGGAVGSLGAYHMWRTLEAALGLPEGAAVKKIAVQEVLRYAVFALALGLSMLTDALHPVAVFLGIFGLKIGAYMQPAVHKLTLRLYRAYEKRAKRNTKES